MSFTVTKKFGEQGLDEDSATEVWTVISDDNSPNPGLRAARNAPGVPVKGQSYPGDFFLQVTTRPVKQLTDFLFEVTVNYSISEGDDGSGDDDDPLTIPVKITYNTVLYQEMMDADAEDNPVDTENAEPFDPPITVDQADIQVTFTKNFATFSLASMAKFQNKVNADEWFGFAPQTVRVTGISGEEVRAANNDLLYYRVSVTVQIRDTTDPQGDVVGWQRRVLHQGFRVWTGEFDANQNPTYKQAKDSNGDFETEPVLLDGQGARLAPDAAPIFLTFKPYKSETLSSMNLGV